MDVLFYALAVYAGYRTALKPPTLESTPRSTTSDTTDTEATASPTARSGPL